MLPLFLTLNDTSLAYETPLYAAALAGHAAIWIALVNNIHGTAMPRLAVKLLTLLAYGWLVVGPPVVALWVVASGLAPLDPRTWPSAPWGLVLYLAFCLVVAIGPLPLWFWRRLTVRPPAALRSNHTVVYDLRQVLPAQPGSARFGDWALRLAGNEALELHVHEKTLVLDRLPAAFEGFSIAHVSDLHFTGRIPIEFFQEIFRRANEMDADLVAITGDLFDAPRCLDWIPETVGRLRARHGTYFVLGNHDLRVDVPTARRRLVAAGACDLGGTCRRIDTSRGALLLAGNEAPWFRPTPNMDAWQRTAGEESLRILLSHSPDQIEWARRHDFDLMLAGHTHGGQVALPVLGPVLAPSRYGVKYASGAFHEPPTVMHVSRGVSSKFPLRWNAPPELTKLILRRPTTTT